MAFHEKAGRSQVVVAVAPFAQKKSSDTRTQSPLENPLNPPPDAGNSASLAGQLS